MKILRTMLSRKWILTTLFVIAGSALCVRLGIWQLSRLDERRAGNAHYALVHAMQPLHLDSDSSENLAAQEFREITARGRYDFTNQVVLRNQANDGVLGYHLVTPLVLKDGAAIMVDRGFIPAEGNAAPTDWRKYDQPGEVVVSGIIRLGATETGFGAVSDPTETPQHARLNFWIIVNLERIAKQVPYQLLPVYIEPNMDPANTTPPIVYQLQYEVTEGPHLGYAIQWFTFASLLFLGYPFIYLPRQGL